MGSNRREPRRSRRRTSSRGRGRQGASRARRSLDRRSRRYESKSRLLIVCEDKKREPEYFRGLKREHRLDTVDIHPCGRGSDPNSIVDRAIELSDEDGDYDESGVSWTPKASPRQGGGACARR